MIPGRGLGRLLLIWLALSLIVVAAPQVRFLWISVGCVIVLTVVAAAVELWRPLPLEVERVVQPSLPVGEWTSVVLRFASQADKPLRIEVFDHYPAGAEGEELPIETRIPAGRSLERAYRLRPGTRGEAPFGHVEVWHRSSFDLLRRRHRLGTPGSVRVLPNFRPVLLQGLVGIEERMAQLGMHLQRRRGEGLEFQELRDFRDGDTLRRVDWKATARRGKLIARQYEDERNQQVVLLLDCGRRMHAKEDGLSHFDHVLNAALLLTYVAVRQGDAVGLQAFSGQERWLPPVRGLDAPLRMLEALHDLQTSNESPDYPAAAAQLMERQRRRALVVLITNLRDEDADELLPAIDTLRRRHLVLVASTRELALGQMRDQEVNDHRNALEVSSAHHYLAARHRAHESARAAGAWLFDVEPPALPFALVAKYLDFKRAGQL